MNVSNAVVIGLTVGGCLLMYQRTERSRKWVTAVFLVLPALVMLFLWAQGTTQWLETGLGFGMGLLGNILYWVVYGRTHPPGSSDSIKVIGMDE